MLENARHPIKKMGKNIVLYGLEGSGKTTIASYFPKPFFLRTEDGTESIANNENVFTLDVCKTKRDVFEQLAAIAKENHEFKTLVIDSISSLNYILEQDLIAEYKVDTVAQCAGGYGNGYAELANTHKKLINYVMDITKNKGMNAVLICHAEIDKISPPDLEAYNSYFLRIPKKSRDIYMEFADCVAFIDIKTVVNQKGKGISSGERRLICHPTPAHQSKNRWGIDELIIIEKDKNPLEKYL